MWRYYAGLYYGIVCTKTGGKMNLRATLYDTLHLNTRRKKAKIDNNCLVKVLPIKY